MPDRRQTSARSVLERTTARERGRRIHDVSYELAIALEAGATSYQGSAVVELDLTEVGRPLFLDFTGTPMRLAIGGVGVDIEHREHRLWLPAEHQATRMRVEVDYVNRFDSTGDGFHHFVDPEDDAEYVYSNFEPFAAHRLFPCFDQPDLKATYALEVTAPQGWIVVSAEPVLASSPMTDGRVRHTFARTRPFSTYLFPLVAGRYVRLEQMHDGITLGILGRRSMRAELERHADELFELTAQGFDYFRSEFSQPYPFTKYDQIFVPEFNAGAMENVGAVTFHDSFLFREPPTYEQRLARGEVLLHELAHMWFGDLVTSRWWDDLWLNESFATYMSYLCLAEATRFSDAWQVFNGQMRPAALRQDQLVTTHPIAADVPDTEAANENFDAITYEKGAAVLKQLVATIGRDAFREGMRGYFERHAWGNATLRDFLSSLGSAAGRDLHGWAQAWLETPAVNTIGIDWTAREGRIADLEVWQSAPPEHPRLRPHTMSLALVAEGDASAGLTITSLPFVIEDGRASVPAAVGLPAPVFIHPDHGDQGYALTHLDPVSLAFAHERLPDLPEPLLRQQVWSTLWQMVRDVRLPVRDYLATWHRFAPLETDVALVQAIVDRTSTCLARYVPDDALETQGAAAVRSALDTAMASPDLDLRLVWLRAAIGFAGSAADVTTVLAATEPAHGPILDQDMRWALAVKAVAFDHPEAEHHLEQETRRDRSDRGVRARIKAESSRPAADAKSSAWERIHGEGYGSDYLTRFAIAGFQWRHQRAILQPYREPFFTQVRMVHASRDHGFARWYVRGLLPDRWAEPEVLQRIETVVAELKNGESALRRQLVEAGDDLSRTIRVQGAAAGLVAGPVVAA